MRIESKLEKFEDDKEVSFNYNPVPLYPSQHEDAPDIPEGLLPREMVPEMEGDYKHDDVPEANTPLKSNVTNQPPAADKTMSQKPKKLSSNVGDDDFISVSSGATNESRFSVGGVPSKIVRSPSRASSTTKRKKMTLSFSDGSKSSSEGKKTSGKRFHKKKRTSANHKVKRSKLSDSSDTSMNDKKTSRQRSPKKKGTSAQSSPKKSPKKEHKKEHKKDKLSKLSSKVRRKSDSALVDRV